MNDSDRLAATSNPGACDLCRVAIPSAARLFSLVRDSSSIHPYDPDQDGGRLLTACNPDHLGELQQHYRLRPFVNEELRAGKITRALRTQPGLDEEELAQVTGLNFLQIEHTLTWESERFLEEQAPRVGREEPEGGPDTRDAPEPG